MLNFISSKSPLAAPLSPESDVFPPDSEVAEHEHDVFDSSSLISECCESHDAAASPPLVPVPGSFLPFFDPLLLWLLLLLLLVTLIVLFLLLFILFACFLLTNLLFLSRL
uniref:Uncharacterized protein n=1 Tax=Cacopsylla melanoneura TaxID=428564 RepID=A0A8D8VMF4_9HEMI